MINRTEFNKFVTAGICLLVAFVLVGGSIYFFNISNLVDLKYTIFMVDDSNTIKGGIEANNVKINNLDVAVENKRDGAIYIGGMTAAAKIMKSYF